MIINEENIKRISKSITEEIHNILDKYECKPRLDIKVGAGNTKDSINVSVKETKEYIGDEKAAAIYKEIKDSMVKIAGAYDIDQVVHNIDSEPGLPLITRIKKQVD